MIAPPLASTRDSVTSLLALAATELLAQEIDILFADRRHRALEHDPESRGLLDEVGLVESEFLSQLVRPDLRHPFLIGSVDGPLGQSESALLISGGRTHRRFDISYGGGLRRNVCAG